MKRSMSAQSLVVVAALTMVLGASAADFTPPDKDKALEAVKELVATTAKSGKKTDVWLKLFGKTEKVELVSSNSKNLTVKVKGNNFDQAWDKLTPDQVAGLGKSCIGENFDAAVVVADYCAATEQGKRADEALTQAATIDPKKAPTLKARLDNLKNLPGAPAVAAAPAAAGAAPEAGAAPAPERRSLAAMAGISSGGVSNSGVGAAPADLTPYAPPAKLNWVPSKPGYLTDIKTVAAAVDNELEISLAEMGIKTAPVCDPATFLRRAYLDICGQIPSPEEVIEFYKSGSSADARAKKIQELLDKPEYADNMTIFWGSLLVGRRTRDDAEIKTAVFRSWLREQFEKNVSYDKVVTELLTTTGENDKNGAANYLSFHMDDTLPLTMGHITQTFLGKRIACAQCHDHPFDKWTQQDFWSFSSFLANTRSERREKRDDPADPTRVTYSWHIMTDQNERNGGGKYDPPQGDLKLPPKVLDGPVFAITKKPEAPKGDLKGGLAAKKSDGKAMGAMDKPGMDKGAMDKGSMGMDKDKMAMDKKDGKAMGMDGKMGMDGMPAMGMMGGTIAGSDGELGQLYRRAFAGWITSPENEWFSQSAVNRIWRNMFGYGLVEPIDDIRPKNPPSHPGVMKILADDFTASGRDMKRLIAIIANTKAYQRASNGSMDKIDRHKSVRYAARAEIRPMTPEMLFASILKATGGEEAAKQMSVGMRSRDKAMMTGNMAGMEGANNYAQLLQRFIGTSTAEDRAGKLQFEGTVSQALMMMHSGFINGAIKSGVERFRKKGQGDMVYIFAATLGRGPTGAESAGFSTHSGGLDGIMWILLNSAEFMTIH